MGYHKKIIWSDYKVGKVIWYLTMTDIFSWGTSVILSSLTGIYISMKLGEDGFVVIGTTITIYYLARAIFQLPIGMILDKIEKDKDEIIALTVGVLLMGSPFLFYPWANFAWQFYLLHLVFGIGASLNLNAWRKLFAKNIDSGKEGLDYGIYETVMSLGAAAFSFVAGYLSNILHVDQFAYVIVGIGALIISSGIWSLMLFTVHGRKSDR